MIDQRRRAAAAVLLALILGALALLAPRPGTSTAASVRAAGPVDTDDGAPSTAPAHPVDSTDTTAPTFDPAPPVVVPADGPAGAAVTYDLPTASDLVDGAVTPGCVPAPGALFPPGDTVVSCTAADAAGNTAATSFTVTVTDTDPPRLRVPPDQVVEATGPDGAAVTWSATATDNTDPDAAVVCDAEPSVFTLGLTIVTCRAVDGAGNLSEGSFTVDVVDTTAPAITFVGPAGPLEATGPDGARARFEATATDLVDGEVPVFCTPQPGAPIPFGTTPVHCAAADRHGNVAMGTLAELVVDDTLGPAIEIPGDLVVEATGPDGARVTFTASATDAVDGPVAATCGPASGLVFPPGETTVNCNAEDASGNPAEPRRFTVTVADTVPPAILVPEGVTATPAGLDGGPVNFTAVAVDGVDGESAPVCDRPAGSVFPIGVTRVTCHAVDAAGNRAEAGFEVYVTGLTPIGFQAPVDGGNVVNTVQAGATVPLVFEIFAGRRELTSTAAVEAVVVQPVACDTLEPAPTDPVPSSEPGPPTDPAPSGEPAGEDPVPSPGPAKMPIPSAVPPGPAGDGTPGAAQPEFTAYDPTGLTYDITTGVFVGLWTTPDEPGTCHRVTVTVAGGQSLEAVFELT